MADRHKRVESLASQILLYKKLYYTGRPSISDEAYDALEDQLKSLAPEHPVLALVGYSLADAQAKVPHEPPMLSLAKTYEPSELLAFVQKQQCIASDKFDGMAMALEYDLDGKLFRASTRGSGRLGEDVTEHIFHVTSIPKRITYARGTGRYSLEIRGEVFFPVSEFAQFAERFDSYRNAVPGTFGRKEVEEAVDVLRVLKFCSYDVVVKNEQGQVVSARDYCDVLGIKSCTHTQKLAFLEAHGLYTGYVKQLEKSDLENLDAFLNSWFEKPRDYQIDGIVFRVNDDISWENLGTTSHHPRGSLAFKQTGEVATTKILAIEESVGRSGKMTFRAQLEPVYLSGAKISYATLHNADFIEQGGYAPGAVVKIKRSGEVIPSIIGLAEPASQKYELPQVCPCGYPADRVGPDLFCAQKRPCPPKDQESLVYFVHVLDILGVSDKIILRLREAGIVNEPSDLFKLTVDDLLQIEGFAQKSAENTVKAIQSKRSLPLAMFLTALGLKRGGAVKCQEVARKFRTLDAVLAASPLDLAGEKGWADKSAQDFFESLHDKQEIINNLLRYVKVEEDSSGQALEGQKDHPYYGKTICITGSLSRPREEYKILLEKVGAKLASSVTSKTDFLVSNETSGSSKFQQAVKLGVPILNEQQFAERL